MLSQIFETNVTNQTVKQLIYCLRITGLFLLLIWQPVSNAEAKRINVAFLNPATEDEVFWLAVTRFMQAAADDLNINLDVYYSNHNRFDTIKIAKKVLNADSPPDFLIYHYQSQIGDDVLQAAENAKVKSFIFNTQITASAKEVVGNPREKYRHWIGHMSPNDEQAGFDLAQLLINQARKQLSSELPLEVVGISGARDTFVANERNKGLMRAIESNSMVRLNQLTLAYWSREKAAGVAEGMMGRYPNTQIFWVASDAMALGAVSGLNKRGKRAGSDVFVGGIDWTQEGINAVANGKLTGTVGGHFMEGAWVMVLLHDYFHGIDFANEQTNFETHMQVITADNVSAYKKQLTPAYWESIDFKHYSKKYHPELKRYDFSLAD